MQTSTVTISNRSRNLGYGWTNSVVQGGGGHLRIASEEIRPCAQGGPATIHCERANARRINSGNDWAGAMFVGGRRVVGIAEPGSESDRVDVGLIMAWLADGLEIDLVVEVPS